MFGKLVKAIALNKATDVLNRERSVSVVAQCSVNEWALKITGKPAYSDDGILQDNFQVRGWDWFSRYFWVNYTVDGQKKATAKFSNETGNLKKSEIAPGYQKAPDVSA